MRVAPSVLIRMRTDAMPPDKRPSACIGCGACESVCPRNLRIPQLLHDFSAGLDKLTSWEEVCRQRAAAAAAAKS